MGSVVSETVTTWSTGLGLALTPTFFTLALTSTVLLCKSLGLVECSALLLYPFRFIGLVWRFTRS